MIFVSALRSGNDQTDIGRREPLALLAEANVAKAYRLDPARIYIGGFSGGARVAERVALAYPDVFRGAILDAGSDPIGSRDLPIPQPELFRRFQDATRLVYVTGQRDITRLSMASASVRSMHTWCQFNIDEIRPDLDHDVADARTFARALEDLTAPVEPAGTELVSCRAAIDSALAGKLRDLDASRVGGKPDEALLKEVDARFGGLAAKATVSR